MDVLRFEKQESIESKAYLDNLIPSARHNHWVRSIWAEADT